MAERTTGPMGRECRAASREQVCDERRARVVVAATDAGIARTGAELFEALRGAGIFEDDMFPRDPSPPRRSVAFFDGD